MTPGLSNCIRASDATKILRVTAAAAVAVLCAFTAAVIFNIRVNTTMSEPVGLYVATAEPSANMVEFCPSEPLATFARRRGYRAPGNCPDGAAPLLKEIVAQPGDVVDLSAGGVLVNGVPLANTAPLTVDNDGRPLPRLPLGRYVVPAGMVWVASTYHPRSLDSRYFGPITIAGIRSRLSPLLVVR